MKGRCDECGMEDVVVMSITMSNEGGETTLCN